MAIIRKSEIKGMSIEQLLGKKIELQKEMIKVNAQLSTKTTPENPGRIRAIKKTIARINTLVHQKRREVPQKNEKPNIVKKEKEVKGKHK